MHFGTAVQFAQPQDKQLSGKPTFGQFQRLVAAGRRRLPLQMPDLLLNFIANVLQPFKVLARVSNPRLCLAPPLLVTGDASSLLDEPAHLVRLRLDDPRNHSLLDDRVTARAETGTQEELSDVLAPAARTIDQIARTAIAEHFALQSNFGIGGVWPSDLAVTIVEYQLDRGLANRLACARAIEDHVCHRVAAQMLS